MIKDRQIIRDFSGRIIGKIETDQKGDKIVRDFYGRIIGRYDSKNNVTKDFHGRIVARGDACSLLINRTQK